MMAVSEEPQDLQTPSLVIDALLCDENSFEEDFEGIYGVEQDWKTENCDENVGKSSLLPLILSKNDLFWEEGELDNLISKEGETRFCFHNLLRDRYLEEAREEAVLYVSKVSAHYGFSALTTVLAVNYFDRFIVSQTFQRDKPWMTQLAVVACLSLAAKVEETQVPLLLDLQVKGSKYLFEAKTIQRMELLILTSLNWRMNPVTPISFFEHIVRRLGLKTRLQWEFLCRCERLLLSVITDSKIMSYDPCTLAAATMIHVIREIEPRNAMEYKNQLMDVLRVCEEKLNDCYKLLPELSDFHVNIQNPIHKRKIQSIPCSADGIIDISFSYDSSNDSWSAASAIAFSLHPPFKRSRTQDQHMQLTSLNRLSVDVLSSPH